MEANFHWIHWIQQITKASIGVYLKVLSVICYLVTLIFGLLHRMLQVAIIFLIAKPFVNQSENNLRLSSQREFSVSGRELKDR